MLSSCNSVLKIRWIIPCEKQLHSYCLRACQPPDVKTVFRTELKLWLPGCPGFLPHPLIFCSSTYPHHEEPRLGDVFRGPQHSVARHLTSGCVRKKQEPILRHQNCEGCSLQGVREYKVHPCSTDQIQASQHVITILFFLHFWDSWEERWNTTDQCCLTLIPHSILKNVELIILRSSFPLCPFSWFSCVVNANWRRNKWCLMFWACSSHKN